MKVICIDADGIIHGKPLTEGQVYEVSQSPFYIESYIVKGKEINKFGGIASYKKHRFIPLSDIDETELATISEQDKVYH